MITVKNFPGLKTGYLPVFALEKKCHFQGCKEDIGGDKKSRI